MLISTSIRSSCRRPASIPAFAFALTPVNDLHVLRFNLRDPRCATSRFAGRSRWRSIGATLIAAATHGSGILVDADQSSNGWAYDADDTRRSRTIRTVAKRLSSGRTFDLTLAIAPQIVNGSQLVAAIIQEDLRTIGIRATHQTVSQRDVLRTGRRRRRARKRTLPALLRRLVGAGQRPRRFMAFDLRRATAGRNQLFVLVRCARQCSDSRRACDGRPRRGVKPTTPIVQRAIAAELPIFTLWQVRIPDAYRTYVHGIAPAPGGSTFWNAWKWPLITAPWHPEEDRVRVSRAYGFVEIKSCIGLEALA